MLGLSRHKRITLFESETIARQQRVERQLRACEEQVRPRSRASRIATALKLSTSHSSHMLHAWYVSWPSTLLSSNGLSASFCLFEPDHILGRWHEHGLAVCGVLPQHPRSHCVHERRREGGSSEVVEPVSTSLLTCIFVY